MNKLYLYIFYFLILSSIGCSKSVVPTKSVVDDQSNENSSTSELEFQYTFTEANKQLLFSNIKQAALLFDKCTELDSTRSMPYYQLANIYYRAGDSKSALNYAKKAYEKEDDNIWVNRLLIELFRINNKLEEAIDVTEKTILLNPESIEFRYILASIYHDAEKSKKALDILDEIENRFGISEEVSLSKHQIYSELGKNKEAEDVLLKLIELNPNEYRFLGMLAEFYSSIDKNKEAEEIYVKLINENSSNPYVILSAAEHYRNLKNYTKSKELYSSVLLDIDFDLNNKIKTLIGLISNQEFLNTQKEFIGSIIDSIYNYDQNNIKILTLSADYNIRINNFEEAKNDLAKVLELDNSNMVIWEQILYLNNRQNDNVSLLKYSEQALKYFPDNANFYLFKGLAEMNLSEYDKSITSFKKGIKLVQDNEPLEIQFLTFLGDVYRNAGNDKKSDEYFEKVLEKDPDNLIVLNNYSYYLSIRDEKLDLAEQYSRKTVERDPENSTYLDTYAWVLYKLKRYPEAKKYIEKAIDNNGSKNSEILGHYGDILVKLKDYDNALKYWKLSIEYGGEETELQNKINNVLEFVNE